MKLNYNYETMSKTVFDVAYSVNTGTLELVVGQRMQLRSFLSPSGRWGLKVPTEIDTVTETLDAAYIMLIPSNDHKAISYRSPFQCIRGTYEKRIFLSERMPFENEPPASPSECFGVPVLSSLYELFCSLAQPASLF